MIINLYYLITIRSVWGGYQIALKGMVKKMYADQYNKPNVRIKDLVEVKLWSEPPPENIHKKGWVGEGNVDLRLRNNVVATFGGYSDAPPTVVLREEAVKERVTLFGHCYLMDRREEKFENHSDGRITLIKHDLPVTDIFLKKQGLKIELLGTFSSLKEGLYSKTVEFARSKFLKKDPFVYFLYKIKPVKNGITHLDTGDCIE